MDKLNTILRRIGITAFLTIALVALLDPFTQPVQSQIYTPLIDPKMQFFDSSGNPLDGGLLYTCQAGAACPGTTRATYTDYTGATTNTNPVVLDSAGRAAVFINNALTYKFELQTSAAATLWEIDGIGGNVVTSVTGTANHITVTGTTTPILSLAGPHNWTSQATNGVLYGKSTSPIGATTQGVADSVLASSGTVPYFTSTPSIAANLYLATTYASLVTPPSGYAKVFYCSNCTKATPCASGGSGAIAKFLNSAWDCD